MSTGKRSESEVTRKTPLYQAHLQCGGRMVEYAAWSLPLHFGSQLEEHRAVRRDAGMFDVSHMTVIDLRGPDSQAFLRRLLANDVARLARAGQALYSCMLNETGGVLDDLIVYQWPHECFRLVTNAATRAKVLAWMSLQASGFKVTLEPRPDLAMIAVQGPQARARANPCLRSPIAETAGALGVFEAVRHGEWQVSRTGYTGEDGYEIILPAEAAMPLWRSLSDAGVMPCGLAARDTLRLEAGLRLYGADMDETVSPLEAGLGWTVAWLPTTRRFTGREALEVQRAAGVSRQLAGLLLEDAGVLRGGQKVITPAGGGRVTSGGFSPSLRRSIGFASLPTGNFSQCQVEIRGQAKDARVTSTRFYQRGKPASAGGAE